MRTRYKVFKRSQSVATFFPAWVKTFHSFFWLHVFNYDDLNDVTSESYRGSIGFANEEHNLAALFSWEETAFREAFSKCKSVLVAGAGGGREMIALSNMGLEVVGFDASDDLVEACRTNLRKANVSAKILFAAPGEATGGPGLHDALVIGRGVYHHIAGRENRIKFLKACRNQIKNRSPLVIGDFLTRRKNHPLTAFALSKKVEPGDVISTAFFHYFTREELTDELEQAGFELLDYRPTPLPGHRNLVHVLARSKA